MQSNQAPGTVLLRLLSCRLAEWAQCPPLSLPQSPQQSQLKTSSSIGRPPTPWVRQHHQCHLCFHWGPVGCVSVCPGRWGQGPVMSKPLKGSGEQQPDQLPQIARGGERGGMFLGCGTFGLKLAKSWANQDKVVCHPRELCRPTYCPSFWFPSSFLFFKHLSEPKFPIQPLSQHKPQREHRETSE